MSKNTETEAVLPTKYTELRGKIVDGSITKAEAQELHDAFKDIKPDTSRAAAVKKLCDDVYKDSGPDKFHSFVKQLVEVEKDDVSKISPIPNNTTLEQAKPLQIERGANFYRNASLARNAMIFECTKEGLGKEAFEAFNNNDLAKGAAALSEIKIPDRVKDTYKSIDEFYKENKLETGAARNLVFHAINGAIQQMGVADGVAHPERSEQEQQDKQVKLQKDLNTVSSRGVFHKDTPGALDLIKAQIEAKEPTAQQIENSKTITQKVQEGITKSAPAPIAEQTALSQTKPEPTKPPTLFDKVKAFVKEAQAATKETMHTAVENVIPGRRKLNQMSDEGKHNAESKPKEQTNDVTPEAKSRTWQKAFPSGTKIAPPPQTPAVKNNPQQHKGHGGRGD
jgi:hypothetical protein